MSTLVIDTIQGKTTAGSINVRGEGSNNTNLQQGLAKSWMNLNGTGTIAVKDSLNVSSVSDGGTGIYNFNFGSNMANANYSLTMGSQAASGFPDKPQINSQATGSFQCRQGHASDEVDAAIYNATVSGDLA